ncbi:pleiotropic drug resistance protein 1-like [Dorcoceras hygrometricum]|uniref:Pleiotropic drug resistance protein 1-like n=1 Tax=Dorcoceras hygrometricum TaxID=472368 RepID=A0A2Z7DC18_9LAMI|nr:pleiotropic drug resistance protein 1-like [Dorcoceras hygrometricum]
MITEAHGWEPSSTNAITTKTTYWKLKPRLGTRSHHKGTKFYLHYKTHDRQQLHVPQLANHSLQKWYGMEELLERSPTLPQTYQTIAGNDGNSSEKLTVNSNLGLEEQRSTIERLFR